jgi:aromatic ring-opening dioxygenase catalytic subunit (LigB family)
MASASFSQNAVGALFINHGGGPMPVLGQDEELVQRLRQHVDADLGGVAPPAIILVSAHYRNRHPAACSAAKPRMIYDYGGFPPESYKFQYPAPGHSDLANRIVERMRAGGLTSAQADESWGFDHGTFVPLMIMFPKAEVPVVPVSVTADDEDAATNLAIGEALQPFVDEGALVIGSGATFHNFKTLFGSTIPSRTFDDALVDVLSNAAYDAATRKAKLLAWRQLPGSLEYHPQGGADHFLPLLVTAAAAKYRPANIVTRYDGFGARIPYTHFAWRR